MTRQLAHVLLLLGLSAAGVQAQGAAALDPFEVQERLLELLGRRAPRPVGGWMTPRAGLASTGSEEERALDPWASRRDGAIALKGRLQGATLQWIPLEVRAADNSARPWGINDGPIWQGKGLTSAASGGLVATWRGWRATVNPVLWSAANRQFALSPLPTTAGLSLYSYPTRAVQQIDAPQRFGDGSVSRLDAGQSALSFTARNLILGASTATQRWGPARRNPIIMGQHAGGFGHLSLGTRTPADVRVGKVHVQWLWGRLTESGFFDTLSNNGSRYLTGVTLSFFPKGAPGLELGANRVFVTRWRNGGPSVREGLLIFVPLPKEAFADSANPFGDDSRDQLASVFARWVSPAAGLELYGEWARGDHSWDMRDLMLQPEHASAFVLGFQKTLRAEASAFWHFGAEATLLGATRTSLVRAPRTGFYQHHLIKQGYTQRGQVLGAGIGAGSSQLSLEMGRVAKWGRAGVTLQRTVYDNDRYYALVPDFGYNEAEPALIVDALTFRGPWELGGSLAVAKLYNKGYVLRNDETNVQLGVLARYRWR